MSEAMFVAASGALAQEMRLEILSNNLSNISTAGYKEDRSVFESYLPGVSSPELEEAQEILPGQIPTNFHVIFEGSEINFSQGELKHTGNALDFAIYGKGFFCVETPDGIRYTRNGTFTLNEDGALTTGDGFRVQGEGGEIVLTGPDFTVDEDGNISSFEGKQIGTIKIVDFPEPYALKKAENSLFIPLDPEVVENRAEGIKLRQGFLEVSNVSAVRSMTEMIEVLRAYESYQKVIQSISEITSKAIDEAGTVA